MYLKVQDLQKIHWSRSRATVLETIRGQGNLVPFSLKNGVQSHLLEFAGAMKVELLTGRREVALAREREKFFL
mgnify:CR=1 FL=1